VRKRIHQPRGAGFSVTRLTASVMLLKVVPGGDEVLLADVLNGSAVAHPSISGFGIADLRQVGRARLRAELPEELVPPGRARAATRLRGR
jgi:hypothetical protein